MQNQTQKWFIFNGLLMLILAMTFPFYSPWARAEEGVVMVHLIGLIEALLFFAFAWFWSKLVLPTFSSKLAIGLIYVSFWANLLGTMLVGIFGSGRAEFIIDQSAIPGYTGFWNTLTLLLLNGSEYVIIPILVALLGFRNKPYGAVASKWFNAATLIATVLFTALAIWQTFTPSISNG